MLRPSRRRGHAKLGPCAPGSPRTTSRGRSNGARTDDAFQYGHQAARRIPTRDWTARSLLLAITGLADPAILELRKRAEQPVLRRRGALDDGPALGSQPAARRPNEPLIVVDHEHT